MLNSNTKKWLIYGANGVTGRIIVAEAVRQGLRPILAGRSASKLAELGQEYDLEWRSFDLEDKKQLDQNLTDINLVLNIAGPFEQTALALVEACLRTKTHYLDIANEISVFQKLLEYNQQAQQANISIIPGVGYGTVATNFLAKELAVALLGATHLELATVAYNTHSSAGVNESVLKVIAGGGKIYQAGKLISYRLGAGAYKLDFPDGTGEKMLMPAPLGDLIAAQQVTGIPNVTVSIAAPANRLAHLLLGVAPLVLKIKPVQKLAQKNSRTKPKTSNLPAKNLLAHAAPKYSYAWGRISDGQGNQLEKWLKLGEGYQFTAMSSLLAIEKVLNIPLKGTLMPAQAFGIDFINQLEGVLQLETSSTLIPA